MVSDLSFPDWTSGFVLGRGVRLRPGCVKEVSAFNNDDWLVSESSHSTDWVIGKN